MIQRRQLFVIALCSAICMAMPLDCAAQTESKFDWVKAREVFRKSQSGLVLTDEEATLLAEAKRLRQQARTNNNSDNRQEKTLAAGVVHPAACVCG